MDDRESFGPETITIHQFLEGTYSYHVDNYSDSSVLGDLGKLFYSGAKVQIYSPDGLIHELRVSSSPSNLGYFWDGTSSSDEDPTKFYAEPGTYTVSFTVSSGDETRTVTKEEYIQVVGQISTAPEFTSIKVEGNNILLQWKGGGTLQRANRLTGTWLNVAGAKSPFAVVPSEPSRYYRIEQ